ncbi:hypothetical protein PGTUg99_002958 [Puccinia graminis f. sp. tritici]|uniref:Uncharacterized protein n=1 Tax=Puccinia graminis f. sp. tritici TaxID=56615 RepID=A0A5B0QE65_PUCGR|nr:hypothetical protein PGTUg99_002958 [Puccinia graminis f. sp. tritici]
MSSSQSHFPGGNPPVGVENVNRAYSTILPNSNSSLSRCISAFVRVLLDIEYNAKKSPSNTWMKTPSAHDFHVGSNLPESIILRPIELHPTRSLPLLGIIHGIRHGTKSLQTVNTILQLGILHRWFLGRQKGVRLGQFSHEIKAKKSKSEKKSKIRIQISQHRRENTVEAQRNR